MIKKCATSFVISAMCGLLVNMLIEIIVCSITGMKDFNPISLEYMKMFSSERVAVEVDILLYGVIGAAFSGMTFIYEYNKIGFFFQNLIYFLLTSIVWIPIITMLWQLQRYPRALMGTLIGFAISYIIMSVVGYKVIKRDIANINLILDKENTID